MLSLITNTIKYLRPKVTNIPSFVTYQLYRLKEEYTALRYNLNNMYTSNMELGIYHLYNKNYNDAIFRFKLIDKFLDPNNKQANYWLGWVYLLKENYKKSIIHLTKAQDEDHINLLSFVRSMNAEKKVSNTIKGIPDDVHQIHRDIMADLFIDRFINNDVNLPKELVSQLSKAITKLPKKYNILELGANVGILANEVNRRMQEEYSFISVESSDSMIKLQSFFYPDKKLYDQILHQPISDFLKKNKTKYNIICSMNGFASESNLQAIFSKIFTSLKMGGYFAFALFSGKNNHLSKQSLEFVYNIDEITDQLNKTGFKILSVEKFPVAIKNNCYIFVCSK